MTTPIINPHALEPLFLPWEEPNQHRVRAEQEGQPARVLNGRRPSPIAIVNELRQKVADWRRDNLYPGASDTTKELFHHWFCRSHSVAGPTGEIVPFRYYFCQREAIEALVYLLEVLGVSTLSALVDWFGGEQGKVAALGIHPDEDAWPRYAFKVATGAGKTKIMSLAIVWSYFHALRESDSPMARHFCIVAPNLTVFERLKEDFRDGRIFDTDPLIPKEWRGDWNLSVVLQDEASGAAVGGALYLTNIHRLYEKRNARRSKGEMHGFVGPHVSRARAFDTGEDLRRRISSHPGLMVLNDEAHHVWDPDSKWNDALRYLDEELRSQTGGGLVAQLDFSATPKDKDGNLFKHVICDAPLTEAVDAGIVKAPIIGRGEKLVERADENAAFRYEQHLLVGYTRWQKSREEWERSGKKALLFVMCEDTEAADQITRRLNTDSLFKDLNGFTFNLHTNLKGRVRRIGKTQPPRYEFVESEAEISDEDLRILRELSRDLDKDTVKYRCIVSVLMLREGWDVKNVTTIVPLRPYSAAANILPEQTLGRGLRRMTGPGSGVAEVVVTVEHPAFVSLYKDEFTQEEMPFEVVDVERVAPTTVTVYADPSKDLQALDLRIPQLSQAYRTRPELLDISADDVRKAFSRFRPLPLGEPRQTEVQYEGRHLFTNEIVEQMRVKLPLLESGFGAIAFFREELERVCRIRGTHSRLAPLIQTFLTDVLFEESVALTDQRLVARLADADVREHVHATFVPLIREKITTHEERVPVEEPESVTNWLPFQVTHSEIHPVVVAQRTPFNLVPCNRQLEKALTLFLDRPASRVAAFCKNAGPQALRIDYLAAGNRLSFSPPDFIARADDGSYYLIETKGRVDDDVPAKARAAVAWCEAAAQQGARWEYVYVPQRVFEAFSGFGLDELARACTPALRDLIEEAKTSQFALPLYEVTAEQKAEQVETFVPAVTLEGLPTRYRKAVEDAIAYFEYAKTKGLALSSCFTPLLGPLDDAARGIITSLLEPDIPVQRAEQQAFFEPSYGGLRDRDRDRYHKLADNLRRTLVYRSGLMPLGLLVGCLEYAREPHEGVGGVLGAVERRFAPYTRGQLPERVSHIKDFRNTYIAHQDQPLDDVEVARGQLRNWISGLAAVYGAHRAHAA